MQSKLIKWEDLKNVNILVEREKQKMIEVIDSFTQVFDSLQTIQKEYSRTKESLVAINSVNFLDCVDSIHISEGTRKILKPEVEDVLDIDDYKDSDYIKVRTFLISVGEVKDIKPEYNTRVSYSEQGDTIYSRFSISTTSKILFVENLGFFGFTTRNDRVRTFPMSCKYLVEQFEEWSGIREEFFYALMDDIADFSYAGKDLKKEYEKNPSLIINTPYSVNDYLLHDNKINFVRNKEGIVSENDIKRFPTLFSSYLREAKKLLIPRDYPKFRSFLKDCLNKKNFNYEPVSKINKMFDSYYRIKTRGHYDAYITKDYIDMMTDMGRPVSLSLSNKSIRNKHDEIVPEHREFVAEKMKKKKGDILDLPKKYNGIKIPGFERLNRISEFMNEARRQENCVASYIESVKRGQCAIFSGDIDNVHYTVEVVLGDNNQFFIEQMKAYKNKESTLEHQKYVQKYIDKANARRKKKD